jgi:hypothetical protein
MLDWGGLEAAESIHEKLLENSDPTLNLAARPLSDDYELLHEVGQGAHGRAVLARRLRDDAQVDRVCCSATTHMPLCTSSPAPVSCAGSGRLGAGRHRSRRGRCGPCGLTGAWRYMAVCAQVIVKQIRLFELDERGRQVGARGWARRRPGSTWPGRLPPNAQHLVRPMHSKERRRRGCRPGFPLPEPRTRSRRLSCWRGSIT